MAAPAPPLLLPAAGWSALPPDLVRSVAGSLLATNDIDCYMDCRAVCSGWRAATDDPRSAAPDPRFRLRRWIVLGEVFPSQGEEMLLLNIDTGRFLRKKFPPLSDYYIVATTPTGYLVLAEKNPPHAARVLNPLTGVFVRFLAPVPPDVGSAPAVFLNSSASFRLTLLCDSSHKFYWAGHKNNSFFVREPEQAVYNFVRKVGMGSVSVDDAKDLLKATASLQYSVSMAIDIMLFPVGLPRHMFVTNVKGSISVFRKETGKLVALDSISNYAIFFGHQRSLAIDADKFPGIESNCVYYTEILGSCAQICKCNIKDRKVERISEAAEFVKQGKQFVLVADRPSTIIHLLSSYTINIPESQLALQQIP